MPFTIFSIAELPRAKWAELSAGSLFSSPEFASLWTTVGGTPIFIADEDNGELRAGIAAVSFGSGFGKRLRSMPEGLYGGPFYNSAVSESDRNRFVSSLVHYLRRRRYMRADIFNPAEVIINPAFRRREHSTQILDLTAPETTDSKREAEIRHGMKQGGEVAAFEYDRYSEQFFRLARANLQRSGRKLKLTPEFFDSLRTLSQNDDRILWLMVTKGEILAASHIYLVERKQMLYWQSFFDREFSDLKPNYLMLDYAIRWARARGLKYFNFGASPEGAETLIQFKSGWGGVQTPYFFYTYKNLLGKLYYRGKRA